MITEFPFINSGRTTRFSDRTVAGRLLAQRLSDYRGRADVVVLALPRGGVPVAFEVARELGAPLDVFVVRKLGVPGHRELAMGAIAPGGVRVLNDEVIREIGITTEQIAQVAANEQRELERRERLYRAHVPPLDLRGRTTILVDDGLATGATMRAAVVAVRQLGAARVVVAIPVGPGETYERFGRDADEVVCLMTPTPFWAIGQWYDDFSQVSDENVRELLEKATPPRTDKPTLSDEAGPAAGREPVDELRH